MIDVDASAVQFVLRTASAEAVADRIESANGVVHGPHVSDVEVLHVLRRYDRERIVDSSRIRAALSTFGDLTIHRHEHTMLMPRVWELRANLTACDATYVALAEALDVPLVTCDQRLGRAAGIRTNVEVL